MRLPLTIAKCGPVLKRAFWPENPSKELDSGGQKKVPDFSHENNSLARLRRLSPGLIELWGRRGMLSISWGASDFELRFRTTNNSGRCFMNPSSFMKPGSALSGRSRLPFADDDSEPEASACPHFNERFGLFSPIENYFRFARYSGTTVTPHKPTWRYSPSTRSDFSCHPVASDGLFELD